MKKGIIKSISVFLAVLMFFSTTGFDITRTAHAEETQAVMSITNIMAKAGNEFSVDIDIEGNPGVTDIAIEIAFDENALSLTEMQSGEAFRNVVFPSETAAPVCLTWKSDEASAENGSFATLTFKLAETIAVGDTSTIDVSYIADKTLNGSDRVTFQTKSGTVTAVIGLPGDINGDGVVNGKDLLRARKYFAGWKVEVDKTALDATGDGVVNGKDLLRLRKFFSDWDVEIFYGKEPSHTHFYTNWEYVNDENHIGTCKCGQQRVEQHVIDESDVTEDEDGNIHYLCNICAHSFVINKEPDSYAVVFTDDDGSVLSSISFDEGERTEITAPPLPEKTGMRFIGWSTDPDKIRTDKLSSDLIVYPKYVAEFNVTFFNEAGTIVANFLFAPSTDNLEKKITYPDIEQKEGYSSDWSVKKEELADISKDISVYPVFTRDKCTVTFYDFDGTVLQNNEVLFGHAVTAPFTAAKWYFDFDNNEGMVFTGWNVFDSDEKILKTVSQTENWDGSIDSIKQNVSVRPNYVTGCNEPKLVFSKKSNTKLNLSLLIPKDYSVNAFSFKVNISDKTPIGAVLHSYAIGSDFVSKVQDEQKEQFTMNELEKYFTYYFVSPNNDGTKVTSDKSYSIIDFEIYDNGGHLMSFADKDLSEIFSLNEAESKLVYRVGSSAAKTEALSAEFQK